MTEVAGKMASESVELMNRLLAEELSAISAYRYLRERTYRGGSTLQAIEYRHREIADAFIAKITDLDGIPTTEPAEGKHWNDFLDVPREEKEELTLPKLKAAEERSIREARDALTELVLEEGVEYFIEHTFFDRKWENVRDLDKLIIRQAA